jgi:hypothetical protein
MPLIRGHYPATSWLWKLLGGLPNVAQSDVAARSNLEWVGVNSLSNSAIAATGISISVPCPVEYGDIITKVSIIGGATASATSTHSFVALYQGTGATPALMAQSADDTAAAPVAANTVYTRSLATPQLITPTNAPNGFVYVSFNITATTVPTLISHATATAAFNQIGAWFTGAPRFLSASHDSAAGATAPATMGTQTALATGPIVFLT